jgi:RNA polymerase sigma factor (sigma-70 family)
MDTRETGEELLRRFQGGDDGALDPLCAEYLPRLHRWARRRFPTRALDGLTADDMVQEAFVRSLSRLRTFHARGDGALFAYFRAIVQNQARDGLRRSARRRYCEIGELASQPHPGLSPFDELRVGEEVDRYRRALARLSEPDRRLVVSVLEHRCSDQELARLFAKPSRDAARVARGRALTRLSRAMARV